MLACHRVGPLLVSLFCAVLGCQTTTAPTGAVSGKERNVATRIYANVTYVCTVEHRYRSWRKAWLGKATKPEERKVEIPYAGSAFVLQMSVDYYLVTAAHVAYGPKGIQEIGGEKVVEMRAVQSSVRVGGLSLAMGKPVLKDDDSDVVVYRLSREEFDLLKVTAFQGQSIASTAKPGEEVTIWGFPCSTDCNLKKGQISSLATTYFTLNIPVEPGFSGGPVLNMSGRLLGIVLRSDAGQTRCLRATELSKIIR